MQFYKQPIKTWIICNSYQIGKVLVVIWKEIMQYLHIRQRCGRITAAIGSFFSMQGFTGGQSSQSVPGPPLSLSHQAHDNASPRTFLQSDLQGLGLSVI